MKRAFNFCPGPAMMPLTVLEQAQRELLNWAGIGASVMEVSHRSTQFEAVLDRCEALFRSLLTIPEEYAVLFLQGGAYGQFAAIPMNLLGACTAFDLIDTGAWSQKAATQGAHYANVKIIASSHDTGYHQLPDENSFVINQDSAYLHICSNETINGVEFSYEIDSPIPLVADMSSNILSKPINVSNYGLIYAGAQKNMGPSGVTVVIVRKDLLGRAAKITPEVLNYTLQAKNRSMINTPPTFALYIMQLVLEWLTEEGGVVAMAERNTAKAQLLYQTIDGSDFYHNPVALNARSKMNIPFTLKDPSLDQAFMDGARAQQLINLAGHRSVGGMRASIYNAMPLEGVQALCDFMSEFEKTHG